MSVATSRRAGFTLVEVLVVLGIIAMLISILLPTLNHAREAARQVKCVSNLRQIGIALQAYHTTHHRYPSLADYPRNATSKSWSVHAKLMPYLVPTLSKEIVLTQPWTNFPDVTQRQLDLLVCPSDPRGYEKFVDGALTHAPTNYAANAGTWFVYDPATGRGGDGAFVVNQPLLIGQFKDPVSRTIAFAEVKTHQPFLRDSGSPGGNTAPAPTDPAQLGSYGGSFRATGGHTSWVDGNVHQTGFTTTFAPNAATTYTSGGQLYHVDFTSSREGVSTSSSTYAAITARSWHRRSINVVMMDGSVQAVPNSIPLAEWRAMGTRAGQD